LQHPEELEVLRMGRIFRFLAVEIFYRFPVSGRHLSEVLFFSLICYFATFRSGRDLPCFAYFSFCSPGPPPRRMSASLLSYKASLFFLLGPVSPSSLSPAPLFQGCLFAAAPRSRPPPSMKTLSLSPATGFLFREPVADGFLLDRESSPHIKNLVDSYVMYTFIYLGGPPLLSDPDRTLQSSRSSPSRSSLGFF